MGRRLDLTGGTFGRLTVLGIDRVAEGRTYWVCECSCANKTHLVVRGDCLVSGQTMSCGCLRHETVTKHGMYNTRLHRIWTGMRQRCTNENNPKYYNYGGRGVTFDPAWGDFEVFKDWALANGYTDELSIDRIDNESGYYPSNCRWTDIITQENNRSSNCHFSYSGEIHTIADWSRILDVKYHTLYKRILRGDLRDFEDYFDSL